MIPSHRSGNVHLAIRARADIPVFVERACKRKPARTMHAGLGVCLGAFYCFVESVCFLDGSPLVCVSEAIFKVHVGAHPATTHGPEST